MVPGGGEPAYWDGIHTGIGPYLIRLDDTTDEEQQYILLKLTAVARIDHALQTRDPGPSLACHLQGKGGEG